MSDDQADSESTDLDQTEAADLPLPQPVDIRSQLQTVRQAARESFQEALHRAGGPSLWINQACPGAKSLLADLKLTEADVSAVVESETQAFWVGLESRTRECASCPPEGAACLSSVHCFSPGVLVKLRVNALEASASLKPCERYQEYAMARRLERAGVDAAVSTVRLSMLGAPSESFRETLAVFLQSGASEIAPRKQQLLLEGKLSRQYAVVLFRNTMKHYPNASYRSVHVPSLFRQWRAAYAAKEPSPMDDLPLLDLLVLDGVDRACLKNEFFGPELLWIYERRRDQGLSTIITTEFTPVKEAFQGARVLKV